MKKIDEVLNWLMSNFEKEHTANEIADALQLDRTNASRYLNQLQLDGKIEKQNGRPVKYKILKQTSVSITQQTVDKKFSLDFLIGAEKSLIVPIQQAKAAILYPPRGLHTLILGETGVGKSMFAELMYQFAKESSMISSLAPFVRFNCADYAENPQLLTAQIFGVKKGAYTGADKDREGLLSKANGGMIFLDEVHRLSHQGQEMLFTFIDKGYFRRLGDSEDKVYAEVQIIAATTEEPESTLLKTFTRRIPMTIQLPDLKERGLKDRYMLIQTFIKEESKRLSKSIYINKNALESFMLYECPSNIGQLKSDIQLACAKAFFNYKSQGKSYILIELSDIPQQVGRGHLRIKENRQELEKLIRYQDDIFKFHHDEDDTYLNEEELHDTYFYEQIENKLSKLRSEGLNDQEINQIMSMDIEKHFRRYIVDLAPKFRKDEIAKVVDVKIVEFTEHVLSDASLKLKKEFDEKIFYGFALHLNGSIERLRGGKKIYHPKLNLIRVNYPDEFLVAMEIAKQIDETFSVETPLDEIGYLAMFLASTPYELTGEKASNVAVLIIMHGNSTATSMAQVVNTLIGTTHCHALDMPLSMKPQNMVELATQKVKQIQEGKGVILLVDMGSLVNFSEIIYDDTGISCKTLDCVSTPIALEACRRAVLGRELVEIHSACSELMGRSIVINPVSDLRKKNLIITVCFTGEGASERLKDIIQSKLELGSSFEVVPMNILNRKDFAESIIQYRQSHEILAIVGTVEVEEQGIPFISAVDLLAGEGIARLKKLVAHQDDYIKIGESLSEHIQTVDAKMLISYVRQFIVDSERKLKVSLADDVKVGIALHLSFLVDHLKQGISHKDKGELDAFISKNSREMTLIKQQLVSIERMFDVRFSQSDIAYLTKMMLSNHQATV